MWRLLVFLAFMLAGGVSAYAQQGIVANGCVVSTNCPLPVTSSGGGGSSPTTPSYVVVAPTSGTPTPCQGGTGSPVVTVGTSATLVCAAATGTRTWYRIANASAASVNIPCTDDGTTPSATHFNFIVYAQGWTTSDPQFVSTGAISCIAASATTIAASASQVGAP